MDYLFHIQVLTEFVTSKTMFLNRFKDEYLTCHYRTDYEEMLQKALDPKGKDNIFTFGDFKEVQDEIKRINDEPEYDLFQTSREDKLSHLIQLYTLKREFVFDIYRKIELETFCELSQRQKREKEGYAFKYLFDGELRNQEEVEEETKNFLLQFYPKYQELFKNLASNNIHIEMEKLFFKIHNHFYENFKKANLAFKDYLDEKYFKGKNIEPNDEKNDFKEACLFSEEELRPTTKEVKSYDEIMEKRIRKRGK